MNMMIGVVRKIMGVWTGSTFAKGTVTENNGMTIYRLSERPNGNDDSGKGKRLHPVPVSVKQESDEWRLLVSRIYNERIEKQKIKIDTKKPNNY